MTLWHKFIGLFKKKRKMRVYSSALEEWNDEGDSKMAKQHLDNTMKDVQKAVDKVEKLGNKPCFLPINPNHLIDAVMYSVPNFKIEPQIKTIIIVVDPVLPLTKPKQHFDLAVKRFGWVRPDNTVVEPGFDIFEYPIKNFMDNYVVYIGKKE